MFAGQLLFFHCMKDQTSAHDWLLLHHYFVPKYARYILAINKHIKFNQLEVHTCALPIHYRFEMCNISRAYLHFFLPCEFKCFFTNRGEPIFYNIKSLCCLGKTPWRFAVFSYGFYLLFSKVPPEKDEYLGNI